MADEAPSRRGAEWLGTALYLVLWLGLTPWGIGWSFYRHGVAHGVAAVLIPPYAWYRGVAATWEKPKWKEPWESKTEQLGALIVVSSGGNSQLETAAFKDDVRQWIDTIPMLEKRDLRAATNAFGDALVQAMRNIAEDALHGDAIRSINDPSVAVFRDRFRHIAGLNAAWQRVADDEPLMRSRLQDQLHGLTPAERVAMLEKRDLLQEFVATFERRVRTTIDEVFGREK